MLRRRIQVRRPGRNKAAFNVQERLAAYVEEKLRRQIDRTQRLVRGLDAEQRRRPRNDGGWSIEQILAHLARMDETYLDELNALLDGSPVSDADEHAWKPTIGGRLLRWSVTAPIRVKTPRIFQPTALTADDDALEAFLARHREVLAVLNRMRPLKWTAARVRSPATSLLRLNPGDVFLVLADHADRHLDQIERQR